MSKNESMVIRRYERFNGKFSVHFAYVGVVRKGMAINFSQSGLFVQAETLPDLHQTLEITCSLGKMGEIKVKGKIVWVREGHFVSTVQPESRGFGFDFIDPPKEYQNFIKQFQSFLKSKEARLSQRIPTKHRVTYTSGFHFLTDYCANLSKGGLFLSTQEDLQKDQILSIDLEVPGIEAPIHVEGKVMYKTSDDARSPKNPSGVGIQFINISPDAISQLQGLLKRLRIHQLVENKKAGPIPDKGELKDHLVPEILISLFQRKASGSLALKLHDTKKTIYIKNGHPFFVDSNLRSETLGHHLVKMGIIEENTFLEISKDVAQGDFKFGELLLKKNYIDPSTLSQFLVSHQEEKLSYTLQYFDGQYEFIEQTEWPSGVSFFPIRLFHTLFSGAQYWYDEAIIYAWSGLSRASLFKLTSLPQNIEIPPYCLRMLSLLREPKDIESLSNDLKIPIENIYPLIFIAHLAQWIAPAAKTEKKSPPKPLDTGLSDIELQHFTEKIQADFEKVTTLNFFELFEFKPADSIYSIDSKYFKWVEEYKNEKMLKLPDPELISKANMISATVRIAYDTIKDGFLRQLYLRRHSGKINRDQRKEHFQADLVYMRAIQFLEQKNMPELLSMLEKHPQLMSKDGSLLGLYGWALFLLDAGKNLEDAQEKLDVAITKCPADAQLRFFRGKIFEHMRLNTEALEDYQKAISLQPNFMKAVAAKDQLLQQQTLSRTLIKKKR